jgi:hypothetical protein
MKPEDCRHRVHKSQSVVLVLSLHSKYTISNYLNKPANATENLVTLKWQFFFSVVMELKGIELRYFQEF